MKLFNEHKLIIGMSFGLLIFGILLFQFGIAGSNGSIDIVKNARNSGFYMIFGYTAIAILIPYFVVPRDIKERLVVVVGGIICAALIWIFHPAYWNMDFWSFKNFMISSSGFGVISFAMVVFNKKGYVENGEVRQKLIDFSVFMMLFQFYVQVLLALTVILQPTTFDAIAYHIDLSFGVSPSVLLAKIYNAHPWFAALMDFSYDWVPLVGAFIFALQLRHKKAPPANMLLVWAIGTVCCLVAYHFCPISGPLYLFGKDIFPNAMPNIDAINSVSTLAEPAFRNGFPSMHFGFCLMMLFTARYQKSRGLFLFLFTLAGLTILSTLAKGEHYLIDLVVSVPYIVAIQSYCTHVDAAGQKKRVQAILAGAGLWLVWVILVRFGVALFEFIPGLVWLLSLSTIAASLFVYKRIWPHEVWGHTEPIQASHKKFEFEFELSKLSIPALFFISGFTGLMYEVVFAKELALTFGSMATATYTVLSVYMGGMAIGSWLGGILVSRSNKSGLILYAMCELFIGVYCVFTPFLFSLVKELYVALAQGYAPDATTLITLRVLCGSLVLLIPTVLMGLTLPVITAELQRRGHKTGTAISKLYGANTLGAASGALISGYFILPFLGIFKSVALSAAGSLAVAYFAINLNKHIEQNKSSGAHVDEIVHAPTNTVQVKRVVIWSGLLALFLTGCVTMLMEVNYMQLLAVVAGNSAYAFSLMLFTLLLGLGAGATGARFALAKGAQTALMLTVLLLGLAIVLLLGVFQWNSLPNTFAAYEFYAYPLNFAGRELVRAYTCWLMMFPPAVLIGACYPIALELVTATTQNNWKSKSLGSAIGLNTLGNIVGAVIGGFILLPLLGTEKSIWVAASLCLFAGTAVAIASQQYKKIVVIIPFVVTLVLFGLQPDSFNFSRLANGANVYFKAQINGTVIDHAESLDGGLTTVAVTQNKDSGEIKTLLTNGKFQGNNALKGEMKAQLGFAVAPLLQTTARDRALVIGYGTGVSSHAIKEAGFKELDIAELSKDLLTISNKHFANVNGKISEQEGVHTYVTDGRNFLLLQDKKYDLISMEITSIWFAGAGSLYNHEFYELAARRLTDYGVLQQWVQLHHMSQLDMACILSSLRTVFPNVSLYVVGGQGVIIATKKSQNLSEQTAIDQMQTQPGLMAMFQQVDMKPADLSGNLLLSAQDTDRLVKRYSDSSDFNISTDDNLYLEYSTPKGNTLDAAESLKLMHAFLMRFSTTQFKEH